MLEPVFFSTEKGKARVEALANRQFEVSPEFESRVREILQRVRAEGDPAVLEYTRKFDAPDMKGDELAVSREELRHAYGMVDKAFLQSLEKAIGNIEEFHERQMPRSWFMTREDGVILGQSVGPVDAAGLYVPGGTGGETPLVSSVLMNGIPAAIAGVSRVVLATPPNKAGGVNPYLLVAAAEVGVDEIYKMGSAWAIGALAYGTGRIAPVDVIVGPGNIYVTLAKKIVSGTVGIDMVAGPSEVLIIADSHARADFVAADLLSQAEHDAMATAILVTDSEELAGRVSKELEVRIRELKRVETAAASLEKNGLLLVVGSLDAAADISNRLGPEHLELMVSEPWKLLPRIHHAGAIFMGSYSPEPIGDYVAGPNHVLPTMGTARFSSALGVETFLKRSSIISYTKEAFEQDADDVMRLAAIEGLEAHARSVGVRTEKKD